MNMANKPKQNAASKYKYKAQKQKVARRYDTFFIFTFIRKQNQNHPLDQFLLLPHHQSQSVENLKNQYSTSLYL